ncbi:hypothetical protein SAMN05444350_14441 [Bacteroides stercorirosoris]|uniref:Uncharacterized protein n=1 Tax=Bacteroides stercorirosoris TaxID=871324 RepID=A0A1M6L5Z6_9BACE|nr:hypothetical protein SAMN05444350_14441 [Bacteroides stercorirosoris]
MDKIMKYIAVLLAIVCLWGVLFENAYWHIGTMCMCWTMVLLIDKE